MAVRTPILNLNTGFNKSFAGIKATVNPLTDSDLKKANAFAPAVKHYVATTDRWVQLAVMTALKSKKHLYVHGKAGSGKDALFQQVANQYRIPFINLSFKEGVDINEWIVRREIKAEAGGFSTKVEEGVLLKAIKGFSTEEGNKIPYMILISDMDRALPSQLEILRQALQEGTSAYLINPIDGEPINVLEGTLFVMTGNSALDGDLRGNMVANRLDASILNRLVCIRANNPTDDFFVKILANEFPTLTEAECKLLIACMNATSKMSEDLALPIEISIRTTKAWARLAIDALECGLAKNFKQAIQFGFDGVIDGFFSSPVQVESIRGAIDNLVGGSAEAIV
jgi:MoxR-like ATPase